MSDVPLTKGEYIISRGESKDSPSYVYDEDRIMADVWQYIDTTYGAHYAQNKVQATEFIIDSGHGLGFCIGNILKYAQRYGKKDGMNKNDLMKVIHYSIIALSIREEETLEEAGPHENHQKRKDNEENRYIRY